MTGLVLREDRDGVAAFPLNRAGVAADFTEHAAGKSR
jgi:hypothetical protein